MSKGDDKNIKYTKASSNLLDTHFEERKETLQAKREIAKNIRESRQKKLIELFSKEKNIDRNTIEKEINPHNKEHNLQLQWEFEKFCNKEINNMILDESDEYIAKSDELTGQEKAEYKLSKKEKLSWDTLEKDMTIDTKFIRRLAKDRRKAQKMSPEVKVAVKHILAHKMIAIANENNLWEDDDFRVTFIQKYVKKSGNSYVIDEKKFANTKTSRDFSIFSEIQKYDVFQNISVSGKELIEKLEKEVRSVFVKKGSTDNIYNEQSLSNKRILSDYFSWRYYNQPYMKKNSEKGIEQIKREIEEDANTFNANFFGDEGIDGNGLASLFNKKSRNHNKKDSEKTEKETYYQQIQWEVDIINSASNNFDPFSEGSEKENKEEKRKEDESDKPEEVRFTKENIQKRIKKLISGKELQIASKKKDITHYASKLNSLERDETDPAEREIMKEEYEKAIQRATQYIKECKEDKQRLEILRARITDMYVEKLNTSDNLKKDIAEIQHKITNFDNEKDSKELEELEDELSKKKNVIFANHIKEYITLAQKNKDPEKEGIFTILLKLSQHNFIFGALTQEEQSFLVKTVFAPKIKEMFNNTQGPEALGLNKEAMNAFVDQLLDFEGRDGDIDSRTSQIKIPNISNPENPLVFDIQRKFKNNWNINTMSIEDLISNPPKLENLGDLPIDFNISLDKLNKEQLKTIEHCPFLHKNGILGTLQSSTGPQVYGDKYQVMVRGSYQGYWSHDIDDEIDDELYAETGNIPGDKLYPELRDGDMQKDAIILVDKQGKPVRDTEGKLIINIIEDEDIDTTQNIKILNREINIEGKNINQLFQLYYYLNGNINSGEKEKNTVKGESKNNLKKLLDNNFTSNDKRKKLLETQRYEKKGYLLEQYIDTGLQEAISESSIKSEEGISVTDQTKEKVNHTTINYFTDNPNYRVEVYRNGTIEDDQERKELAIEKLQYIAEKNNIEFSSLSLEQQNAIIESHLIGKGEIGDDKEHYAGVFNYTKEHIKSKIAILQKSGLEKWQIKTLLLYGFCGSIPTKIAKEKAKIYTDEIEKQFNENISENEKFDEDEWNDFHDEVKKEYNKFEEKQAKDAFKRSFKDKYNEIPDSLDGEVNPHKEKLGEIIDTMEGPDHEGERGEEKREEKEENEKTPKEEFLQEWDDIGGEKIKFEKGNSIYLNIGESNYPPSHDTKARLKLEIEEINGELGSGTFKVRVYNATSDFEGLDIGMERTIPATAEMLRSWKTTLGTDYVRKVKKESNPNNFEEAFLTMKNADLLGDYSTIFGKEGEDTVWLKNNTFWRKDKDGKDVKVKYFSSTKSIGGKNQIVDFDTEYYEIEKIKDGKITFKTSREDLDPNKPAEKVKNVMKRTLNYSDFILLMEDKQLTGYAENPNEINEHQVKDEIKRDPARGDFKFYSINALAGAVKQGRKKVFDEKLKSYEEDQKDALGNVLYSKEGLNIFGLGAKMFGSFSLTSGLGEAFDMAGAEYFSEREDRAWKRINYWYGIFDKDPHFGSLWHNGLKQLFELPPEKIQKSQNTRYKFAAAMLITMKKDGPWTKFLQDKPGKGFRVERILGEEHKKRFKDFQENKERELKNHEKLNHVHWKNPRTTMLARLEFDYIVGVIDGRKPYGDGALDENYQASRRSRKFAEQLQENTDKYFGSAVKKAEEIKDIKDFPRSQQEYYRHMGTMRPHKAIPYLLNMARTAQSNQEMSQVKRAILGALLSGMLWNHADHATRTELWKISRSMGFIPGTWIREQKQKEMVWKLLKHVTGGSIEQELNVGKGKYSVNKFAIDKNEELVGFITQDFPTYRAKHGDYILKMLEMKSPEYRQGENSILTLAHDKNNEDQWIGKKYITPEFDLENDDQETRYIYQYAEESPWTASKSLVRHYMPQNGKFVKQTDEVEIEGAKAFWRSVTTNLDTISNPNDLEFFFSRFHSWFSENVFDQGKLSDLLRSIGLVEKLKAQGRNDEGKYILWYAIYGNIIESVGGAPAEFSSAINKFVDLVRDKIEYFDLDMANNVFGDYTNTVERDYKDNHYTMIKPEDRERFRRFTIAGSSSRERTDFLSDFDEGEYVWGSINRTRNFLKKQNILSVEPTPPWKS